ncbi:MAG: PEP-CTERM sorting domain-containing protein [Deltaproteobacteria bacterium]|nr:PEP-CTERM sorting domain-containing protein [Deltaproteobacteria bacterium]
MQDLVGLADHSFQPAFNAIAWAVSADGSVVAGSDWSDNIPESGFRWTADGGGELISYGNEPSSIAIFDISPDGTTVVGQAQVGTNEIGAFIWRADTGLVSLTVLLTSMGVDLTGWTLRQAVGISADGTTIAGNGTNPSGRPEGFLMVIPEPSVGILMGIGLLGLASRGSTKRRHGQNRSGSQP